MNTSSALRDLGRPAADPGAIPFEKPSRHRKVRLDDSADPAGVQAALKAARKKP